MRAWAAPILSLALAACGGPAVAPTDAGITDTAPIDEPLPATDGGAGYALSFDGVDDYATAGNGGFTTAEGTTTIELWVRFESGATEEVIYGRNEPSLVHFHRSIRNALGVVA